MISTDTIVALATPQGKGALGILRLSGPDAIAIADSVWKGKRLVDCASHTVHLGEITDEKGECLDHAVATIFKGPKSFTGEDSVEFSLHGSPWILREVTNLLIRRGARGAEPGEYTRRAYLNGRMDLASAEGVADLIASSSKAAHRLALLQTKGAFSKEFNSLRDKLIELASLLELELDFSEEDVEFADRSHLEKTAQALLDKIDRLTKSFASGKAFKEGVPVVIAGIPNVGKSTLLNTLIHDEKAIVSDVPGTTRDIIEDTVEIDGVLFRFFDTAGLRESSDTVENIGIERARNQIDKAAIVLWLIDPTADIILQINELHDNISHISKEATVIPVITKLDMSHSGIGVFKSDQTLATESNSKSGQPMSNETVYAESHVAADALAAAGFRDSIAISAIDKTGIDTLCDTIVTVATHDFNPDHELLLTNARHYSDLMQAGSALRRAIYQMNNGVSSDFIAMDIRQAISSLSSLTGAITTTDLLTSIFSRFCIGK